MDLSPLIKIIPDFGAPTLQDFDTSNIQDGQRIKGLSNRQFVRFYNKKEVVPCALEVKINEKTGATKVLKTGTKEVIREMVNIVTPGDKNEVDDFAEDFHRREHWKAYKAFRDGTGAPIGKSIEECTYVSSSIATELRYLGCHTEEQLADGSDILCNQVANGFELREFARAMVKANLENKSLGQVNMLKSELLSAQALSAKQGSMIAELQAQMAKLAEQPAVRVNKGGRPRKQNVVNDITTVTE